MAKTITINDSSDKRVQVKNIDEYALRTAVSVDRGVPTYVQDTPKTNSALQMAEALRQTPNVMKQFTAIQKAAGEEEASAVKSTELLNELKQDSPTTFLTYAKQKAFRDSLQKRYIQTDFLPRVKAKANDLVDVNKYKTWDEFTKNGLQPFVDEEWASYQANVGEDLANSKSSKILFGSVTDNILGELKESYLEAQDTFTLNNLSEEKTTTLTSIITRRDDEGNDLSVDAKELENWVKSYDTLGKEYGVDNASLSKAMRSNITQAAERLRLDGKLKSANELMDLADKIVIGGQKIFGDTATQKIFAQTRSNIRTELESDENDEDSEKFKDNVNYATQQITTAYGIAQYQTYEALTTKQREAMLAGFQRINPDYSITDLNTAMSDAPSMYDGLESIMRDFSLGGDVQRKIWSSVSAKTKSGRVEQQSLVRPSIVPEKGQKAIIDKFKEAKIDDPELTAEAFAKANRVVMFPALVNTDKQFDTYSWFYNDTRFTDAKDRFRNVIELADEKARGGKGSSSKAIDTYMDANYDFYINDIKERVLSGNLSEADAWTEMETMGAEASERFMSALHYEDSDININDMTRDDFRDNLIGKINEEGKDSNSAWWKIPFVEYTTADTFDMHEYPSLKAIYGGSNINTSEEVGGTTAAEVINKDRETMINKDAAKSVNTRNTRGQPDATSNNTKMSESRVNKMSTQQYEKHQDEIMEAIRKGEFIYDISGSAR